MSYQTIPLSTGIIQGLFPTIEWFRAMPINWGGKTVLDLGCCSGSYGIQALREDAAKYIGVDHSRDNIEHAISLFRGEGLLDKAEFTTAKIEDYQPQPVDITIFSLIIHWLPEAESHLKRYWINTGKMVIFWRGMRQGKEEVGFRPSVEELNKLFGKSPETVKTIINKGNQYIMMGIW